MCKCTPRHYAALCPCTWGSDAEWTFAVHNFNAAVRDGVQRDDAKKIIYDKLPTANIGMSIKIHNLSTCISDADVQHMVDALNILLPQFCEAWKLGKFKVLKADKECKDAKSDYTFYMVDSADAKLSDADGYVFAKTVLDCGGATLWRDDETVTVASALSHEIMETLLDRYCNMWVQSSVGTMISFEICDPVQNCIVRTAAADGTVVGLANFILPEWMNPRADAQSKFDHLGVLSSPFSMSTGGYVIVLGTDGAPDWIKMGTKTNLLLLHHKLISGGSRPNRRANRPYMSQHKRARSKTTLG